MNKTYEIPYVKSNGEKTVLKFSGKYEIDFISMLTGRKETLISYGNSQQEAIERAPLRCNEATLEMEKVLDVRIAE